MIIGNNIKKRVNGMDKLIMLRSINEEIFSLADIEHLWKFPKKNTLYTTLSRYVKNGILYKIQNGLYSFNNPKEIHPYLIGTKSVNGFAYVSCESMLYDYGLINQKPSEITILGNKSFHFTLYEQNYKCRQLNTKFLLNPIGIIKKNGVWVAGLERALADMIYMSPKKYLDGAKSNIIDWTKVKNLAENIGYPTSHYKKK